MALIFRDLFTRASNITLASHTPDTAGLSWTRAAGFGTGTPTLRVNATSDRVEIETGTLSNGVLYTAEVSGGYPSANYEVSVIQAAGDSSDDKCHIVARYVDSNNFYGVQFNTTDGGAADEDGNYMYKKVGGTVTRLGSNIGAVTDGHVVKLVVNGSTIQCYVNGVQKASVTDTAFASAGKAGLGVGNLLNQGADMSAQQLDDFQVNTLQTDVTVNISVFSIQANLIAPLTLTPSWYNTSWRYRKRLTANFAKVGGSLTDFPAYVPLSIMGSVFHDHVKSDGGDIRITTSNGTTELPREIVFIDTSTDTGEMHFRADALSNTVHKVFFVYYGNASASEPAASASYGSQNVWSNNYAGVYHMQQDPSGGTNVVLDSTSNARHLSTRGSMTSGDRVAGKLAGYAYDLDGSDDELFITSEFGQPSSLTLQGWVKKDIDSGQAEFLSMADTVAIRVNAPGFNMFYDRGVGWNGVDYNNNINLSWHLLHFTVTAGAQSGYVNGFNFGDSTYAESPNWANGNTDFTVGVHPSGSGYQLDGDVDEVRISSVVRSDEWILTEYNNQNDPSSFWEVSAEEEVPGIIITPSVFSVTATLVAPSVVTTKNVTLTPSVFSVVTNLQAPAVRRDWAFTVALNSVTANVQAPVVRIDKTHSPSVLSVIASLQSPAVLYDKVISIAVQSVVASVQAPSVKIDKTVSPSVLSAVVSVVAPTVTGGAVVTPAVQSVVASVVAPTVKTDRVLSIPVFSITANLIAPTLLYDKTISISALSVTANLQAPSVAISEVLAINAFSIVASVHAPDVITVVDAIVPVSVQSVTANLIAPAVSRGSTITPAVFSVVASVQAPAVFFDRVVSVAVQNVTANLQAPVVRIDEVITPAVFSLTANLNAPSVFFDRVISVGVQSITANLQNPTVFVGTVVNIDVQALTVNLQPVSVSGSALITPAVFSMVVAVQNPSVLYGTTISVNTQSLTASVQNPTIVTERNIVITPVTLRIDATALAPSVRIDKTVEPATLTLSAGMNAPAILTSSIISVSVLSLAANVVSPVVIAENNFIVTIGSPISLTASVINPTVVIVNGIIFTSQNPEIAVLVSDSLRTIGVKASDSLPLIDIPYSDSAVTIVGKAGDSANPEIAVTASDSLPEISTEL